MLAIAGTSTALAYHEASVVQSEMEQSDNGESHHRANPIVRVLTTGGLAGDLPNSQRVNASSFDGGGKALLLVCNPRPTGVDVAWPQQSTVPPLARQFGESYRHVFVATAYGQKVRARSEIIQAYCLVAAFGALAAFLSVVGSLRDHARLVQEVWQRREPTASTPVFYPATELEADVSLLNQLLIELQKLSGLTRQAAEDDPTTSGRPWPLSRSPISAHDEHGSAMRGQKDC